MGQWHPGSAPTLGSPGSRPPSPRQAPEIPLLLPHQEEFRDACLPEESEHLWQRSPGSRGSAGVPEAAPAQRPRH